MGTHKKTGGRSSKIKQFTSLETLFFGTAAIVMILLGITLPAAGWYYSTTIFDNEAYNMWSVIALMCIWFIGMSIWSIKCNKKHKKFAAEYLKRYPRCKGGS